MASRSFHALFLRARDHLAASSRWLYLAVLTLMVLHVAVVTPFVEGRRIESETSTELERLNEVERGLGELRRALQGIRQETTALVTPSLDRLAQDLELDFARLDATRQRIAAQAAAEAAAADQGAEDGETTATSQTATSQTATSEDPGIQPFELQNADWIADLRDATSRDETLAVLTPIVDQLIIRPRYFDIDQSWKDDALPRLEARLDAAASAVPRLRGRFSEARAQWDTLTGVINDFTSTARALRFTAPDQPFWWTLPTVDGVDLGLSPAVRDTIRRPRPLSDLETTADRCLEHFGEVSETLTVAKRQLDETSGVGVVLGIDLAFVMPMFPLLIGWLIAAALLWRSQRLRELELATRLAIEHGGPSALQRWLWHQTHGGSTDASAEAAWRRCVFQTSVGYFLAIGWIALAAAQLRELKVVDRDRLMLFTIVGAVSLLIAIMHRLIVARRAITFPAVEAEEILGDDIPEMQLNEALDGDSDSELIDVQTLRR